MHAAVVWTGGEVAAVVAGAAGEIGTAPEDADTGPAGEKAAGVGWAEEGEDRRAGEAGEVQGAGVVGEDEVAGVGGCDDFGQGERAEDVQQIGMADEGGEAVADPEVVRAAEENDLAVLIQQGSGDGGVAVHGPAAERLLAQGVAGAAGNEGDAPGRCFVWKRGGGQGVGAERGEAGVAAFVCQAEQDAGELAGVVAGGQDAPGAVGSAEGEVSCGAHREGEDAPAAVVVERGAQVVAGSAQALPQPEE